MRIKNVIRNTAASVGSYVFLFFINIIVRKFFLAYFDVELLGYEGLFGSIFLILSMAEMGSNSMFDYMLYEALAKKDEQEVSIIMGMYQKLYRLIGVVVFTFGMIVYGFLPFFIREDVSDWSFVRIIYLIQLGGTLITYFLAYRRTLLIADQKSYEVTAIDTIYKFVSGLCRIISIIVFNSYLAYLIVPIATNLISNINISKLTKKKYKGVSKHRAKWDDFRKRDAFSQLKSLMVHKISTVIYNSSDNFIISTMIGIKTMGFYSNYQLINSALSQLLIFFTGSVGSSAGNLMYTESENKKENFYITLDFISFLIAIICMTEMVVCYQKVISFIYGAQYLLPDAVPFILGLNFYVNCRGIGYGTLQSSIGHYETSRMYSVFSAIINVVFSVLLGWKFGISGILAATVAGNCLIQAGRASVVFKWIFAGIERREINKEICFLAVSLGCSYSLNRLSYNFDNDIWSILFCAFLTLIITTILIVVIFGRTHRFKVTWQYVMDASRAVLGRKEI